MFFIPLYHYVQWCNVTQSVYPLYAHLQKKRVLFKTRLAHIQPDLITWKKKRCWLRENEECRLWKWFLLLIFNVSCTFDLERRRLGRLGKLNGNLKKTWRSAAFANPQPTTPPWFHSNVELMELLHTLSLCPCCDVWTLVSLTITLHRDNAYLVLCVRWESKKFGKASIPRYKHCIQ